MKISTNYLGNLMSITFNLQYLAIIPAIVSIVYLIRGLCLSIPPIRRNVDISRLLGFYVLYRHMLIATISAVLSLLIWAAFRSI